MKIAFACIADHASPDAAGKLSVNGIFDQIMARLFPAAHQKMVVVFRVMIEHGDAGKECTLRVRLVDEDGRKGGEVSAKIKTPPTIPPGGFHMHNAIFEINGVVFAKPGRYLWEIACDTAETVSIPFNVNRAP